MKLRLQITALALAALFPATCIAAPNPDSTIRIENGVTVKSPYMAKTSSSLAPEKKASEQLENFPVQTPGKAAAAAAPAMAEPDDEEFLNEPEIPETRDKVTMKPIVDKNGRMRRPEFRAIESNDGPFKKSRDAGTVETVKRPDPKPEVTRKSLMGEDNISSELQNLDVIKKNKDKATNAEDGVGESGLPIPRFVSLKSGEANARTGPGDTYPIRWIYQRKNLPLEVTAEFKLWRRIKDFDGEQSWVHQALLSSRRYCILFHDATAQSDYEDGHNVARFKRGVQVRLQSCKKDACKVEYGNIEGWLKKKDLWGAYPAEVFD